MKEIALVGFLAFLLLVGCTPQPTLQVVYITATPQLALPQLSQTPESGLTTVEVLGNSIDDSPVANGGNSQSTVGESNSLIAPKGEPVIIDGSISPEEWVDANEIELSKGRLLLKQDGEYLYLGIISQHLGLGSVCVLWDSDISILHSSAALGTANYVETGEGWSKTRDFVWTNRDTTNSQSAVQARQEHLERENWLASNGNMGEPSEMEYQILLADGAVRLGVTYLMSPDWESTDFWPQTLGEGCRYFEPLAGDAPDSVDFDPQSWMTVMASSELFVPQGDAPILDGTLSAGEWDDAVSKSFTDGSELYLMHDDENLYLGIRANPSNMIVGNIFIDRGGEVAILHSSAALGTAIYTQSEEGWERTQRFVWRCRSTGDSASARAERDVFLAEDGWLANNSYMGNPNELEYQIAVPEGTVRLAATFMRVNDLQRRVYWPINLDDDCTVPTPGGMPSLLSFSLDQWAELEISP